MLPSSTSLCRHYYIMTEVHMLCLIIQYTLPQPAIITVTIMLCCSSSISSVLSHTSYSHSLFVCRSNAESKRWQWLQWQGLSGSATFCTFSYPWCLWEDEMTQILWRWSMTGLQLRKWTFLRDMLCSLEIFIKYRCWCNTCSICSLDYKSADKWKISCIEWAKVVAELRMTEYAIMVALCLVQRLTQQ